VKTLALSVAFSIQTKQELNNFASRLKSFKQATVESFTCNTEILLINYFFAFFGLKQAIKNMNSHFGTEMESCKRYL
jgi:hypothetical protein